jgi:hypothetical protein
MKFVISMKIRCLRNQLTHRICNRGTGEDVRMTPTYAFKTHPVAETHHLHCLALALLLLVHETTDDTVTKERGCLT